MLSHGVEIKNGENVVGYLRFHTLNSEPGFENEPTLMQVTDILIWVFTCVQQRIILWMTHNGK